MTKLKSDCVTVSCHQWLFHFNQSIALQLSLFTCSLAVSVKWPSQSEWLSLSLSLFLVSLSFVTFLLLSCRSCNLSPPMQIFAPAIVSCSFQMLSARGKRKKGNLTDDISCRTIVCTGIYTRPSLSLSLFLLLSSTLTGDLCFLFLEFHLVTSEGSAESVTDGSIDGPEAHQLLLLTFSFALSLSLFLTAHYGISRSSSASPCASSRAASFSPAAPMTLEKHFHL